VSLQTENRFFDSLARAFTNAAGAANAFREEVETMVKGKLERLVADMDLVTREDFDVAKAMAAKARAENEKLEARVAELEAKLGMAKKPKPQPRAKKAKKATAARPKKRSAKL
jgi:BMFP domain-containing protein YqiC